MKEEDRLAALVENIDQEAAIIPRGAYMRLANGQVVKNKNFEGLTLTESAKSRYYLHFRPPIDMPEKTLPNRTMIEKAFDFLDTIEDDIPNGCWTIKFERGGCTVFVQNLLWLGYTLFHVPEKNRYGSIYVGTGQYNIDLPFML